MSEERNHSSQSPKKLTEYKDMTGSETEFIRNLIESEREIEDLLDFRSGHEVALSSNLNELSEALQLFVKAEQDSEIALSFQERKDLNDLLSKLPFTARAYRLRMLFSELIASSEDESNSLPFSLLLVWNDSLNEIKVFLEQALKEQKSNGPHSDEAQLAQSTEKVAVESLRNILGQFRNEQDDYAFDQKWFVYFMYRLLLDGQDKLAPTLINTLSDD